MRFLLFLGFLALSVLVPVGLAQARTLAQPELQRAEASIRSSQALPAGTTLNQQQPGSPGRSQPGNSPL
jgi:hypothetical protein